MMTRKAQQLRVLDQLRPPDLWSDIRGREPRRAVEQPRGPQRALIAAVALAIVVAALTFAMRAFEVGERSSRPAATTGTPIPGPETNLTAEVVGRVRLEGNPGSVAAANGSIWVTTYDYEDGQAAVVRIDATTNEVVATIPIDEVAYNLAIGAGAVWVPTGAQPSIALLKIDPTTNEVTGRIAGVHGPVVVDATGVWAIEDGAEELDAAVVRIDPETLQIEARVPVGESPFDMVAGADSIWLVAFDSSGREDAKTGDLLRIDSASGRVVARVDIESSGIWIAANDSGVWMPAWDPANPNDSRAYFVDASTDAVSGDPGPVYNFRPFAVADGRVWFITGPGDKGLPNGGVCGLNVATRVVDVCAKPESAPDLEFAHDPAAFDRVTHSIWLGAFDEPWITRIDVVFAPQS
jgi:hypothetical protein